MTSELLCYFQCMRDAAYGTASDVGKWNEECGKTVPAHRQRAGKEGAECSAPELLELAPYLHFPFRGGGGGL